LALALLAAPAPAGAATDAPPNIVMVRTDDQSLESFNPTVMPKTHSFFERRGTVFTNSIVSTPLCCPSRAQALTGQYAHNNGVLGNNPGYPAMVDPGNVLPAWLQEAGYRTIHVGKWMHGYPETYQLEPAPGWDRWLTANWTRYYGANFSIDGELRVTPKYFSDVVSGMTTRAIKRYAPRKRPFYLQVDEYAPHVTYRTGKGGRCDGAAIPAARDTNRFIGAKAPRTPAYDEADVSDKPPHVRNLPRLGNEKAADIDREYGCALASLRSVDRSFAAMLASLRQQGELANTLVVFTSDNGYTYGGHRMGRGKGLPYDEHIRVPMAVRSPRAFDKAPARVPAASANVDLPATFVDMADAEPCVAGICRRLDGRSLVPLLEGRSPRWTEDRAIRTSWEFGPFTTCAWDGYWTPGESVTQHTLVRGSNGCEPANDWEAYDLRSDPFQLEAQPPTPAQEQRLASLRTCTGIPGRELPLPGHAFCE
jgi:N-acetylglucosamine-6-sulfatase